MKKLWVPKRSFLLSIIVPLSLLLGVHEGYPIGMLVEPGSMLVQKVKPGERYDLEATGGLRLKIVNQNSEERLYRITVAKPEQLGIRGLHEGYRSIPEPDWFTVEPTEVTVPPHGTAYAGMFINVPADPSYYNQHWAVALAVQAQPRPGEALALALKPVYYLETQSRDAIATWPPTPLGIVPTVLACKASSSVQEKSELLCGTMKIHNGDSRPHSYTVQVQGAAVNYRGVSLSPGFTWLKRPDLVIVTPEHFTLNPLESRTCSVRLVLPQDQASQLIKRETLIWIRPDEASAGFIRLQIR